MKNNKILQVFLVLGLGLFVTSSYAGLWDSIQKKLESTVKENVKGSLNQGSAWDEDEEQSANKASPPVQRQDKGFDSGVVRQIQKGLKALGYSSARPDGKFGSSTRRAIFKFQKDQGLVVNGLPSNGLLSQINTEINSGKRSGNHQANLATSANSGSISSNGMLPMTPYVQTLLAIKYIPGLVTDQEMIAITKYQIQDDQREYRERNGIHTPLFSKKQVVGRAIDYAAEDLVPVMRKKLRALASALPDRFVIEYQLEQRPKYDRKKGVYRIVTGHQYGRNDVRYYLGVPYGGDRRYPSNHKSLQGKMIVSPGNNSQFRSISSQGWQKSGHVSVDGLPSLTSSGTLSLMLAFDRLLEYKGLPISRSGAEKLTLENQKLRNNGYHDNFARIEFTITGGEKTNQTVARNVLFAKLHKVTMMRFDGKIFATLPASQFVLGENIIKKKRAAIKKPRKKIRATGPYGPMIHGMQLGMKMSDAEKVLKQKIKISRTMVSDKSRMKKDKPYQNMKLYISDKSNEMVVLFTEPGATDKVIGIARRVAHKKANAFGRSLHKQLVKQFGKPVSKNVRSNSGDMIWGGSKKTATGSCQANANVFNTFAKNSSGPVRNISELPNILAGMPVLHWSAFHPARNKWKNCGTSLYAEWYSDQYRSTLDFFLVDQGVYYNYMTKAIKANAEKIEKNKVQISF